MSGTAIETYTGLMFDFADPRPEQVCVEDVAHALSLTCRFGGHVETFYSVAQHALLVHALMQDRTLTYPALHHDSAEAYTGDFPTPLKRALNIGPAFETVNTRVEAAIAAHFGLPGPVLHDREIRRADQQALLIEAATLKVNDGRTFAEACGLPAAKPWPYYVCWRHPREVEHEFLAVHQRELAGQA